MRVPSVQFAATPTRLLSSLMVISSFRLPSRPSPDSIFLQMKDRIFSSLKDDRQYWHLVLSLTAGGGRDKKNRPKCTILTTFHQKRSRRAKDLPPMIRDFPCPNDICIFRKIIAFIDSAFVWKIKRALFVGRHTRVFPQVPLPEVGNVSISSVVPREGPEKVSCIPAWSVNMGHSLITLWLKERQKNINCWAYILHVLAFIDFPWDDDRNQSRANKSSHSNSQQQAIDDPKCRNTWCGDL